AAPKELTAPEAPVPAISRTTPIQPITKLASYELQIASYRSLENAIMAGKSIRDYPNTVRPWKSEEGEEWYRLMVGPFMTVEEASTLKEKIGEAYQFKPFIVQSPRLDAGTDDPVIQNRRARMQTRRSSF
ncbi:MAG: SPOR domain-containing protein, partial [Deltaproteobacteria bacterium]